MSESPVCSFLELENGDPQNVSLSADTCELHSEGVEAGANGLEVNVELKSKAQLSVRCPGVARGQRGSRTDTF